MMKGMKKRAITKKMLFVKQDQDWTMYNAKT